MILDDKTILVTGGTGTFGRAFIKRALQSKLKKLIVFSRDELKQHEMQQDPTYQDPRVRFQLGCIRDRERLRRAFQWVDIVIHAAALKQVPAGEYDPFEFIKTNVMGGMNVADAAIDCGVERLLALSTDKACQPCNLYGQTKACLEKMMMAANAYSGLQGTRFSCVRYGNIASSRGSVIPLFKRLAEQGRVIPITDERMTRFHFRIDQAVEFVLEALADMAGGEIYVPRLPSYRLTDLAEAIAPNCQRALIGIRPGEKVHESMLSADESHEFRARDGWYVRDARGEMLPSGFEYTSGNNDRFLSIPEIREELKFV